LLYLWRKFAISLSPEALNQQFVSLSKAKALLQVLRGARWSPHFAEQIIYAVLLFLREFVVVGAVKVTRYTVPVPCISWSPGTQNPVLKSPND